MIMRQLWEESIDLTFNKAVPEGDFRADWKTL